MKKTNISRKTRSICKELSLSRAQITRITKNDRLYGVGSDIRRVRKELNLTQQAFADLFNRIKPKGLRTCRADITRYETGAIDPPASKYRKFLSLSSAEGGRTAANNKSTNVTTKKE